MINNTRTKNFYQRVARVALGLKCLKIADDGERSAFGKMHYRFSFLHKDRNLVIFEAKNDTEAIEFLERVEASVGTNVQNDVIVKLRADGII